MHGLRCVAAGLAALAALAAPAAAQGLIRDAEIEGTIAAIAAPVFRGAGVSPDSVKIYLIGDRRLNAFVAGGRNIFLFTGLLQKLERPAQIQAVLAHEVGHINGGHLARRQIEAQNVGGAMALGVLLAIAAGVAGSPDAAAAVLTGSTSVIQRSFLAFSRAEEASADQAGLTYLERAGINPTGLVEVLDIFRGQEVLSVGRADPYAQTHPLSQDRLDLVERRVAASPHRASPDDPALVARMARMRAKLDGFLDRPERVLRGIPEGATDELSLLRRAVALYRLPDPPGALRAVDALIAKRPRDPYAIELKAQFLLETGRAAEAVPLYREAVRLAPREPLLRASLGRALVGLGTAEADAEALRLLEAATRDDPANAGALRDLALVHARRGEEGLAALATAERFALGTRFRDVAIHAKRAAAQLPEGSPGWLRAQDLILAAERMAKK